MSRGRRVAIVVAAVLATGAGVAAAVGFDWRSAPSAAPADELPDETAEVTRQTLVDTRTETGTLGYEDGISVQGKLAGTVTALPAAGATVTRGQALYRVDDTPVVLLYGALPAYRPLAVNTEGNDVEQFEQNLFALGYTGFTVDKKYTSSTAAAVKEWQSDLGLTKTGTVEPGRVVYASGPVRVDTVTATVGGAAQGELLTYTGSARVVTVELDPEDQRLAPKGAAVTVALPSEKKVAGKIANAETAVTPADGAGGQDTTVLEVTVAIADQKALAGLDEASAPVTFTASKRPDVLTVPVAALLALAEGGYGVEVVQGRSTKIVAVETGLFADGRVEVSGEGLAEGMKVGMPS